MNDLVNLSFQSQPASHSHAGAANAQSRIASGHGSVLSRVLPRWARWVGLALVLASFQSAFGFALLGPINEDWQAVIIGYGLGGGDKGLDPLYLGRIFGNGGTDEGAPKDFNQGYRRNTPVMYYSMDNTFLTYFGSNGIVAIDQAFQIFNNLPKASEMTPSLTEFPLNTTRVNSTAEALFLDDVKSTLMTAMMEQLGGAEPERYVWAMHDRYVPSGSRCGMSFLVVKRNFDPVTFLPTSYVNGTLYSYIIIELCDRPGPPAWRAVCEPVNTDPDSDTWNAVSDYSLGFGRLYTGLTRDDVGVIRYLLRSNNIAIEEPPSGSQTIVTNTTQGRVLYTSNLTVFAQQALTTNATALEALYPGLVVTSSTNYPVYRWVTNLTLLGYTTKPFDPANTVPYIPVYATNRTLTVQINYQHTFGNIVTFSNTPAGWLTVPVTTLAPFKGRGFAALETTTPLGTTRHMFLTNEVVGDFAILPTNSCGLQVAFPLLTNVYTITNLLTDTNSLAGTNTVSGGTSGNGGTNSIVVTNSFFSYQSLVFYLTNRAFWVYDVDCQTNAAAARQGIEKITFVRRDFDSLINRFFYPITNQYTMMVLSNNGSLSPQVIQRVVTSPDFLISGADLDSGPSDAPAASSFGRNIQFNTNAVAANYGDNAGPGTIEPGTHITFNTAAPVWGNSYGGSEATQVGPMVIWGSFDMSTNPPVVYPSRTSLADLENMLLIQVSPIYLPDATLNVAYQAQLQTAAVTPNWQGPFSWALAPNSKPLPDGLTLNGDGSIRGTPTETGTFYIVVQVTDVQGRTYNRGYPLVVN